MCLSSRTTVVVIVASLVHLNMAGAMRVRRCYFEANGHTITIMIMAMAICEI
jgi:hypothetical protein